MPFTFRFGSLLFLSHHKIRAPVASSRLVGLAVGAAVEWVVAFTLVGRVPTPAAVA